MNSQSACAQPSLSVATAVRRNRAASMRAGSRKLRRSSHRVLPILLAILTPEELPLTTQQFVGYGLDDKGKDYPQTVMCKMKSWDALDFYYPGAASAGADCATVNADTGAAVIESLTNNNQEPQLITEIVYDNWVTFTGQQWTDSAPAPSAYISNADGKLHAVGKQLYVERTNPSPFVPANKKGMDNCQVIAPEYLREVIVGNIQAPTCDAPPVYSPPIFGPPEAPKPWACANP